MMKQTPFTGFDTYEDIVDRLRSNEDGEIIPQWAIEYVQWVDSWASTVDKIHT